METKEIDEELKKLVDVYKKRIMKTKDESNGRGTALRHNTGKLRYDLVQPNAHRDMVKVLTMGADKYADRNWENGYNWSIPIASLKRHLEALEAGEDYDKESGLLHVAHIATNAHFLNAFYYIYPQGDDRPKTFLNLPRIGLDIDEVLADFRGAWIKKWNISDSPSWHFDRKIDQRFKEMREKKELDDFYLNLESITSASELPFEPHCYVTSRPVDVEISEQWLDAKGFPSKPVYCVGNKNSKVDIVREAGVEIFIDDKYENFVELNNGGIFTYLFSQPYNTKYDVGHMRINNLNEVPMVNK